MMKGDKSLKARKEENISENLQRPIWIITPCYIFKRKFETRVLRKVTIIITSIHKSLNKKPKSWKLSNSTMYYRVLEVNI